MATAPEKISVKRRRADEPVGHLIYQSKKQRTTNHVFVRISTDPPASKLNKTQVTDLTVRDAVPQTSSGIPTVRITQPGDEVKDFQKYRNAYGLNSQTRHAVDGTKRTTTPTPHNLQAAARQFHLTRDLSTFFRPQGTGIRKVKPSIRPHLATFVEKRQAQINRAIALVEDPVDSIVELDGVPSEDAQAASVFSGEVDTTKHTIATFQKSYSNGIKTGKSIYDDPATWDIESDELADELAALALEMDPSAKETHVVETHAPSQKPAEKPLPVESPDDFIYETYVRMSLDNPSDLDLGSQAEPFGYLIIDEEEESLWEQYLRDENEDDDDWDEEDQDSNAEENPRNEYPDEELSSDDEFGTGSYKYRRYGSDNEQFDEDY